MGGPRRVSGLQSDVSFVYSNIALTATTIAQKIKLLKPFRLDAAYYYNETGLAAHADNHFTIAVKKGSTVMASWSTDSDVVGQGTIAADASVTLVKSSTDADLVIAAGSTMTIDFTEGGTATLPIGTLVIHGRYL